MMILLPPIAFAVDAICEYISTESICVVGDDRTPTIVGTTNDAEAHSEWFGIGCGEADRLCRCGTCGLDWFVMGDKLCATRDDNDAPAMYVLIDSLSPFVGKPAIVEGAVNAYIVCSRAQFASIKQRIRDDMIIRPRRSDWAVFVKNAAVFVVSEIYAVRLYGEPRRARAARTASATRALARAQTPPPLDDAPLYRTRASHTRIACHAHWLAYDIIDRARLRKLAIGPSV
jgi:hypothetical protein